MVSVRILHQGLKVLAAVVCEDLVESCSCVSDVICSDQDLCCLALSAAQRLVDHYLCVRQDAALALSTCCEENGIKYQRDVMDRGGTDASSMNLSGAGVRVAAISIVDRFPHSQSSIISKDDVRNAIKLTDHYTHRTFVFED